MNRSAGGWSVPLWAVQWTGYCAIYINIPFYLFSAPWRRATGRYSTMSSCGEASSSTLASHSSSTQTSSATHTSGRRATSWRRQTSGSPSSSPSRSFSCRLSPSVSTWWTRDRRSPIRSGSRCDGRRWRHEPDRSSCGATRRYVAASAQWIAPATRSRTRRASGGWSRPARTCCRQ